MTLALLATPMAASALTLPQAQVGSVAAKNIEADFAKNTDEAMRFMTTKNGEPYFDSAKAKTKGADAEILRIGASMAIRKR